MTDEQITKAAELLRDIRRLERANVDLEIEMEGLMTTKDTNARDIAAKRQKLAGLAGRR